MKLATSPAETAYLKFNVSGLSGPLQSATLRVFANSGLRWGFDAYSTPNTSWAESSLTYNNAPALGTKLGSFPSGTLTGWIQLDVTPAVTGNGTYSFALVGTYWMEITLASRESGANAPQLVLTTAGTPDTTPPSPPSNLAVNTPPPQPCRSPGPPQPTTSPSPATTSSSTAANSPPPPPPTTPSPTSPATPPTPSQSTHTTQPETLTATTTSTATSPCVSDSTPPTVNITGPPGGALVSGTVNVQATASDDTAVVGVQLKLDGTSLGAELTSPPYTLAWNTSSVVNGHTSCRRSPETRRAIRRRPRTSR